MYECPLSSQAEVHLRQPDTRCQEITPCTEVHPPRGTCVGCRTEQALKINIFLQPSHTHFSYSSDDPDTYSDCRRPRARRNNVQIPRVKCARKNSMFLYSSGEDTEQHCQTRHKRHEECPDFHVHTPQTSQNGCRSRGALNEPTCT